MDELRRKLNRLAVEFWCGIGDPNELSAWADAYVMSLDEPHPLIWDLYPLPDPMASSDLLLKMAQEINGFNPASLEGEALAIEALKKALIAFAQKSISVQALCMLVNRLDLTFNIELAGQSRPISTLTDGRGWLGNLWNCCDWCDETWTHESSHHLHEEASKVARMLASSSPEPSPDCGTA